MKVATPVRRATAHNGTGSPKVAATLKRARKKKKLSQADLAKLVDVDPGTVAGWETARHGIRSNHLGAVAEALDVEVTELIA